MFEMIALEMENLIQVHASRNFACGLFTPVKHAGLTEPVEHPRGRLHRSGANFPGYGGLCICIIINMSLPPSRSHGNLDLLTISDQHSLPVLVLPTQTYHYAIPTPQSHSLGTHGVDAINCSFENDTGAQQRRGRTPSQQGIGDEPS